VPINLGGKEAKPVNETSVPAPDRYWEMLDAQLLCFSAEEQRAAVTLYRELAKGRPVDIAQLAQALGVREADARALLQRDSIRSHVFADEAGRVLGFGGLAAAPMHHRFEVAGRALWTWCAWDTLFIPGILGARARVASPDPESGQLVELVVTPRGIESVNPESAVISFQLPEGGDFRSSAANLMRTFCHFIFFFGSRDSGERWVARHPGTFLYSLDEAFALAQRLNARNFGVELARRAPAAA
jgi:alkylmercury lyase